MLAFTPKTPRLHSIHYTMPSEDSSRDHMQIRRKSRYCHRT